MSDPFLESMYYPYRESIAFRVRDRLNMQSAYLFEDTGSFPSLLGQFALTDWETYIKNEMRRDNNGTNN